MNRAILVWLTALLLVGSLAALGSARMWPLPAEVVVQALGLSTNRAEVQAPSAVEGARPMFRIGYLGTNGADWPAPVEESRRDSFLDGMRELGYIEGENLSVEYRFADGDPNLLAQMAEELVATNPQLIVLGDSSAVGRAADATTTIPLIMTVVSDPVGTGFAQSLAHPGGNLTGQTTLIAGLTEKRMDLMKSTLTLVERDPKCAELAREQGVKADATAALCLAVLWDQNRVSDAQWAETNAAARALGIALLSFQVRSPDDLEPAFADARAAGATAMAVFESPYLNGQNRAIGNLSQTYGVPLFASSRQFALAGALESYTPSYSVIYRRAAVQAVKILNGARPEEMPIEQPTHFDFIVNRAAADALGIQIAQRVWDQATEVIR